MSTRLKVILYWIGVGVLIFSLLKASQGEAAESLPVVSLTLDQETITRGYTVKSADNRFWLPIFPEQFKQPISVVIQSLDSAPSLPVNYRAISAYYKYEIKNGQGGKGFLISPILLSLKYYSDSQNQKAIFFFDKNQNRWRVLKSNIDEKNHLIRAQTIFPSALIVVLEKFAADGLTASSALVTDNFGTVIYEKNADDVRPLASLTKLMTAVIFLENNPGWNKEIVITADDQVGGSMAPYKINDRVKVKDLFYATLTGSKNNAAHALMRATGLSESEFVARMNQRAFDWGLVNTEFVEPTGLNEKNVSTARDMAILSQRAFLLSDIRRATTTKYYKTTYKRGAYIIEYWLQNTNKLLDKDVTIIAGKTGYTEEAGSNLISQVTCNDQNLMVIVMGADKNKNFDEVYYLMKKYGNYKITSLK